MPKKVRVAIIGGGPAGLTAALYTARAQLSTVVFVGDRLGGQIASTDEVDNYPGFPEGITGPDLAERMKTQAERFGAHFVWDLVQAVDFSSGSPFRIKSTDEEYLADAVIVTIGASPRKLGVPGEEQFTARGVSWCATCDGWFFRGKDIIVVGGGDSALQEGIFLTKFANSVNIVHRRDELRASVALQTRAKNNEKIKFTWNTVIDEIKGNGKVSGVVLRDLQSGQRQEVPVDGVFIFIGHDPNSDLFKGQIAMDNDGYFLIDSHMRTSVEGVFAAGEIADHTWKQAATSVGQGCAAAMSTIHWLEEHEATLQALEAEALG
ncbi:MAG: thioredoxin-disulfide reductase [Chloroflexi bacterium]|nr:thioredoxin-disulfide reductase [Chloroflexota bacterium]